LKNRFFIIVGAALCGHPLTKGFPNSGAHRGAPLHYFRKGGTITPPFSKGRLGGIFLRMNSKGISVLFLVFAMLLMVTIGYVFSYLIPTKQKSVSFPIYSNQAFFIAQSGVEYAVRYSADQGWTTPTALLGLNAVGVNQKNLGNGRFTINYNDTNNTLTSVGEVPTGTERRRISVSNFTSFLAKGLILDPASPVPCWTSVNQRARFFIKNVSSSNIILTGFSATWAQTSTTRIRQIYMNGVQKYSGNYYSGDPSANFNQGGNSQTIVPNEVIQVDVYWQQSRVTGNIVITFYSTTGEAYTFDLDPEGNGLPSC